MNKLYHSHTLKLSLSADGYLQLPQGEEYRIMLMTETDKVCASTLDKKIQNSIFQLICDYFSDTSFEFRSLDHATLTENDLIIPHEGVVVRFHEGCNGRLKEIFNEAFSYSADATTVLYFTFELIK